MAVKGLTALATETASAWRTHSFQSKRAMSALATKRTWPFAQHMSAYDPKRTSAPNISRSPLRRKMLSFSLARSAFSGAHEAARVHQSCRRCSGMAARRAGAAAGNAGNRFPSSRSPGESADLVAAFRKGLRQMGFVEGHSTVIAFRWAEGHYERLATLASDLVNLNVAVLFAAGGSLSALAAKAATSTISVVFLASDPVILGLVSSLNQPGGNVTGISNVVTDLPGKSLGLLKQTVPTAETVGYLVNPASPIVKLFLKDAMLRQTRSKFSS